MRRNERVKTAEYSVAYRLILPTTAKAYAASLLTAHRHSKLASQHVSIALQPAINSGSLSKLNPLSRRVLL